MTPVVKTFPRQNSHPFITEAHLKAMDASERTAEVTEESEEHTPDVRPHAQTATIVCQGVGTWGGILADFIRQVYQALGLDLLGSGIFDLASPRREIGPYRARQDLAFKDPVDLYLYGQDLLAAARTIMGEAEWQKSIEGVVITDRSLTGRGARGEPQIARAASIAKHDEFVAWATAPLLPFVPRPRDEHGLGRWQDVEPPASKVIDITCGSTCGAVGNSHILQTVAAKRQLADHLGLTIEQYVVLLGGGVFGRGTDAEVHGRISRNEDWFLADLHEVMTTHNVKVGTATVSFTPTLLDWDKVIAFNPNLYNPVTRTISEDDRRTFVAEAAISVGIAFASGAMDRLADEEENTDMQPGYIRTMRFVGHGLNRPALAGELAERRVSRMRQLLLDRITGSRTS